MERRGAPKILGNIIGGVAVSVSSREGETVGSSLGQ